MKLIPQPKYKVGSRGEMGGNRGLSNRFYVTDNQWCALQGIRKENVMGYRAAWDLRRHPR